MRTARRSVLELSLAALAAALLLIGCGDDDADPTAAGTAGAVTATTALEGDVTTIATFCDAAPDPSADVAESYVGSAEQVDDLQRLREVAPDELLDDLDVIISHFEGVVDPADPDSQLTENFPDEVNEATRRVVAFTEEHCGT